MIWLLFSCTGVKSTPPFETVIVDPDDGYFPPLKDCIDSQPPIIAIHGFLASADTYESHAARWAANGHCIDRFFGFDWNTFDQATGLQELSQFVELVLSTTGNSSVDLLGHSAGAGLAYEYISSEAGQNSVRKYVHIGFSSDYSPPTIPMLNLYSTGDYAVPGGDIEGVENIQLTEEDHYKVATSEASFSAIYEFLYEQPPQTTDLQKIEQTELWGKALYFGENEPVSGATIEAYQLDPSNGQRLNELPAYQFTVGEHGLWGPLPSQSTDLWELTLIDDPDTPVRHYYAAFENPSGLLRLRGIPEDGLAATILSGVPFDNQEVVNMVSFSKQQALAFPQDSLIIDGEEFITEDRGNPQDTIIALFHFDALEDNEEGADPAQFSSFPFMAGTDSVWAADENSSLAIQFNQQERFIPKWGSGVVIGIY